MAITFISHFRVKPGRSDDIRAMAASVSAQLKSTKRDTAAFLPYLDEGGSTFTIVHVFPDAAALAAHFGGADQRSAAAYALMEPMGWEIYGQPDAVVIDGLRAEADTAGVELVVHPEALPGFLRSSPG